MPMVRPRTLVLSTVVVLTIVAVVVGTARMVEPPPQHPVEHPPIPASAAETPRPGTTADGPDGKGEQPTPATPTREDNPPAPAVPAVPATAAASDRPTVDPLVAHPPARVIAGLSPAPVGGKPVAPCDLSWNLDVQDGVAHGRIVVLNHGAAATVVLTATAIGSARLESPGTHETRIERNGEATFDIAVRLGVGENALTVTATCLAYDKRSRTILIPLDEARASSTAKPSELSSEPSGAMQGVRTIVDASGDRIEFHPSAP